MSGGEEKGAVHMSEKARGAPVKHVAIGASHEVYPSSEAAMATVIKKRIEDRLDLEKERGLPRQKRRSKEIESTMILRSIEGGVDDTKFLYPVIDNIPVIVFPLLSYALAGARVSVYGPADVGRVVDVVRDRLLADGLIRDREQILTVLEDPSEISMTSTFVRSTAALSVPPGQPMLWSAGDLVMGYNVYPWLMDRHAHTHDLVLDLSGKQVIFPPGCPRLFGRNFYDRLLLEDGRRVDVKEPNALLFTEAGLDGLTHVNDLRRPQPGDSYMGVMVRAVARMVLRSSPASIAGFLRYGLKRKRGIADESDAVPQRDAIDLARTFFGVSTMLKVDNADPFFVKDCDAFEDLFGYYRTTLQPIVDSGATKEQGYGALSAYYPHAEVLQRISIDLRPVQSEMLFFRRFLELVRDRISTYNSRISAELRGLGLHDGTPPVPEYFDVAGGFRGAPAPSDDIEGTRALLSGRYRAVFEADRRSHAVLTAATGSERTRPSPGEGN
jgi:hypothetical protein